MQILKQHEYFGVQRRELFRKGVSLSEYDYFAPGTPWHYHENPYFMYVMRGEMVDINKSAKSLLPSGSMMFLNWDEIHRTEKHSRTGRGFHLQIERKWLERHELETDLWAGNRLLCHPDYHLILGRIYAEFGKADNFSIPAIELLVLQLCSLLTEKYRTPPSVAPPWVMRLEELLQEYDGDWSLSALSQQLGVHPVHISRTVPLFLDNTLGEYLRKLRVQRSLPLLLKHQESLAQIALICGFADQSHFTRVFKSYVGMTPARFRRRC